MRRRKPTLKGAAATAVRRLFNPRNTLELVRRLRTPGKTAKGTDDAQLALYAEVLPGGFLNYGYFDRPETPPEQICLQDIQDAQLRYGRLLVEQVRDSARPVLDAGCGMGGLLNLLQARGCVPTALTPDRKQIRFIQSRYPNVPLIPSRFEAIPRDPYRHRFGTVIMSESMQYMKLKPALSTLREVLAPGGRWILCDYFRLCETARRSGHCWTEFSRAVRSEGWQIVLQRDITAHALPAIRFLHMLGRRAGLPAMDYAIEKVRRRRPTLHYLLEEFLAEARGFVEQQLDVVNPDLFQREKAYMFLVLERP